MKKIIGKSLLLLSTFFLITVTVSEVNAVPYPDAIYWKGPPTKFVTSLYKGVLGRSPESSAVVTSWAGSVTSSPSSRLRVFWAFVGSNEYKRSRWARQPKEWNIYHKNSRKGYLYSVAKRTPAGYYHTKGAYSYGQTQAVAGYYRAYRNEW